MRHSHEHKDFHPCEGACPVCGRTRGGEKLSRPQLIGGAKKPDRSLLQEAKGAFEPSVFD